jgi:hypothetical protein
MHDSFNGHSGSSPTEGTPANKSAEREPGKTKHPAILPRDLIFLVAGRLYAENHSTSVDMMPWSIDKALKLWNALDHEIRDRGWMDLLEVAQ